jgi:hypothetical protein
MAHRSGWMFLGASALTGLLAVWSTMAGCRSDETSGSSGGGSSSSSTVSSSSSASSSGSGVTLPPSIIRDITTGKVGLGVVVKATGVVAMSQTFFVSKGSTSGSCLWGVFVSDPNLAETGKNTGILVLSYGTNAATPGDGGGAARCPLLGLEPSGSKIPDDLKPGDVLDVEGKADAFVLGSCGGKPNETKIKQFQISQASSVTKTGTAPLPKPHLLTVDQMKQIASQTDKAFYDEWGGVKVRIENVTSVPQSVSDGDAGTVPSIVDGFGNMLMADTNLQVGDKLYFRKEQEGNNFCYSAPVYEPTSTFTSIEGIIYLNFCTWGVVPNDKCADIAPPSPNAADCNGSVMACVK